MEEGAVVKELLKFLDKISLGLGRLSAFFTFAMMLVMVADILLRFLFNSPIIGSYEIIEQMMIVVVFFAFAHTQAEKGHIAVDIVTTVLPRKVRDVFSVITLLMGTVMTVIAVYANLGQISGAIESKATTSVLYIPLYPFYIAVMIGLAVFCLCLVVDLIKAVADLFDVKGLRIESGN